MTTSTSATTVTAKTPPLVRRNPIKGLIGGLGNNTLELLAQRWQELGDLFIFQILSFQIAIVSSPQLAEEVLVKQRASFEKMGKSPRGDLLALVLGNGLITNPDTESWLSQRRMMQPMFHRRRLDAMSRKMTAAGERMLARWAKLPDGATVDINEEMMLTTMDIVTNTMFSASVLDQAEQVGPAINEGLQFVFGRRGAITLPLSWPLPSHRRFQRNVATLDETVYGFIDERRGHEDEYDDLLSMLLEARDEETGEGMSREQLRDEVASIFGAGHETTSHALTWTLHLLSQHADVAAKLQAEVDDVLQGRSPEFDDLPNLPYAKMVFQESMRLFPPVPFVPRYAENGTAVGRFKLPGKMMALIAIANIHRHPDVWEQPERFLPERFSEDRIKERHRLAFMPFGAGQRVCIGSNFALMEGQLLLAMMAQQYRFEQVDEHEVELEVAVTLRPKNGLPMRLVRR